MSDTLNRMALALSDVEANLIRRRQEEPLGQPSEEFLDAFDEIDDEEDYLFDDDLDNEED